MAELLIKARDPRDLPDDAVKRSRCYRRGDIVVVMPDGHEWGKEERLPKFVVIKIPGMPVETAKKYLEPHYVDTKLIGPLGEPVLRMESRRKYKLLLDNVPAAAKNALTKNGKYSVSWATVKSYVYNKLTLATE